MNRNKYIIETGIGLQDVDKLKNSSYFIQETNRYINGDISLDELDNIINTYYEDKNKNIDRVEEADKISIRIAKILSNDSFTFTLGQYLTIHRVLFDGLLENPGELRKYNFSKKEWVLNGESVIYGDYRDLELTLRYDFEQERKFSYKGLSIDEVIDHLSIFVSNLWQIHVFEEGNTRTTAVFFIKYLRSLGFDVTNDTFSKNAWYFRNALVRANYNNITKGIYEDRSYLIKFLRNLLLGENNTLQNRDLNVLCSVSEYAKNDNKENRIIKIIQENPKVTIKEISKQLGVSIRTVNNIIKVLENNNKIIRISGKRYGFWKTID